MTDRLFAALNIIFITVAIYFGVSALYKIFTSKLDEVPPERTVRRSVVDQKQSKQRPYSAYRSIANRNLFQTKTTASKKPLRRTEIEMENLEQTKLKLKLWGTVTGSDDRAFAVIQEEKSREQNLYKTGDTIRNATVKMILRNRVVLRVGSRDEILDMEDLFRKRYLHGAFLLWKGEETAGAAKNDQ